jgi:hypothetical protein
MGQVEDRQLPYEGTVQDFRMQAARDAYRGQLATQRLIEETHDQRGPWTSEQVNSHLLGASASTYGWGVVALIRWIGEQHGAEQAWKAAAIVQDIGTNGGNHWCEDIPYPPVAASSETDKAGE